MPYQPPAPLASLGEDELAALVAGDSLPPVAEWRPQREGDSRMRIAADGRWFHDGAPIARPAMVRAFARLLWRDGEGRHWLVTPQERLSIAVEDAALIGVELRFDTDPVVLRLNTDELVPVDAAHPLVARGSRDVPALYVVVRHGVEARLNRACQIELLERCMPDGEDGEWVLPSGGLAFALRPD